LLSSGMSRRVLLRPAQVPRSGDDYYVTFTRRTVRVSSYQDDAIKGKVEAWANTVPALA